MSPLPIEKLFRSSRSEPSHLFSGFWVLAAALGSLYYGNAFIAHILGSQEQGIGSAVFLLSITRMLVHGTQNLLLLSGWHMIARGVAQRFPRVEDSVTILLPPSGLVVSFYLLFFVAPKLRLMFPVHVAILFLLMVLFQLLMLRVEDGLDRYAALLLWIFSFQSLELFSSFSEASGNIPAQDTTALGMAGTALFFSFLTGAVSSTWLISRYSTRVSLLRQTWTKSELRSAPEDTGLKAVTMVDVNNLAHDLKNPIAAIKGTAAMLHKSTPSEKSALILKAAEYMDNMVRELLMEDERNAVKVLDLCATIDRHIRPFPWGKDVTITIHPAAEALSISANKIRLLRAVFNVLDNAWRANETTGARGIELQVRRNADYLELDILDNGPGYRAERAQSAKSGWGSTGLGLAFTRRVISLHGGSLLIADRVDRKRGTRVLISLPILSKPSDTFGAV